MIKIISVDKKGIAYELGIRAGDTLVGFNGGTVCDFLDYGYYNGQENFIMTIIHKTQETVDYEIEKYSDEDLGLEFDEVAPRQCINKCAFCFIDQNPKDKVLRDTLLIKDDDYRLSAMCGTFVTMTNFSTYDIDRIKKYKLSPLYISVHSTDDSVRRKVLGNPHAREVLPLIKELHDSGIVLHAQIVYCPDFNDDYSMSSLKLADYCMSVAIVPVGLTKDSNTALKPVTSDIAKKVINDITPLQDKFVSQGRGRVVFLADEFYVIAGVDTPHATSYGNYDQLANGVGLISQFDSEVKDANNNLQRDIKNGHASKPQQIKNYIVITGVAASKYFFELAEYLNGCDIKFQVEPIINNYFGHSITVAGLVTGSDIIKALSKREFFKNDVLLIPKNMLRQFEDTFLDNMTLAQVSNQLGVDIIPLSVDGYVFLEQLIK